MQIKVEAKKMTFTQDTICNFNAKTDLSCMCSLSHITNSEMASLKRQLYLNRTILMQPLSIRNGIKFDYAKE